MTDRPTALDEVGFVVIEGLLDESELCLLRTAFDLDRASTGTQHVDVGDATPNVEAWRRVAEHEAVLDIAVALLDAPRVRVHGRNPLPGYGQQGLHADAPPRRPGDPVSAMTAIWMLDAFTTENGATRIVPGSHVRHDAVPRSLAQPDAHHPDETLVTGPPGSVLIFDGHLWHSGTRNRSTGPRRAVQLTARR